MQLILNLIEEQRQEPGYAETMLNITLLAAGARRHEALEVFATMHFFWGRDDTATVEIREALIYHYSNLVTKGMLLLGLSSSLRVTNFDHWALTIIDTAFKQLHETVGSNFSLKKLTSEIEAVAAESVKEKLEDTRKRKQKSSNVGNAQ